MIGRTIVERAVERIFLGSASRQVERVRNGSHAQKLEIASSPGAAVVAWEEIAASGDNVLLLALARNESIPESVQEKLIDRGGPEMLPLTYSPGLTSRMEVRLAHLHDEVKTHLTLRDSLCREAQELLSEDPSEEVRASLALASFLDEDMQADLAEDFSPQVRASLAQNATLTAGLQVMLSYDDTGHVRQFLSLNTALLWSLPLSARFVYEYNPALFKELVGASRMESAAGLVATWPGDVPSLVEACDLIVR